MNKPSVLIATIKHGRPLLQVLLAQYFGLRRDIAHFKYGQRMKRFNQQQLIKALRTYKGS